MKIRRARPSTVILCTFALLLAAAAAVFAADLKSPQSRTFEPIARLGSGVEVKVTAHVSSSKTAGEAFPRALWWGGQQGVAKSHLTALVVDVGGKESWLRFSAYADLADVRSVELKVEPSGFRVAIEGGEQSTRYAANVFFDNEGYLVRRRVEGASFPTEVWEETNYSFIRRRDM